MAFNVFALMTMGINVGRTLNTIDLFSIIKRLHKEKWLYTNGATYSPWHILNAFFF